MDPLVIVGLGNPGPEYAGTRHNLGQICVAELGRRFGASLDRRRWRSLVASIEVARADGASERVWLLFPQTFMNLSGRAVAECLRDLAVGSERLWVVYDELDLPFCRLRIRQTGSAGGHNGMRSIIGSLKTQDFVRFRVGLGRPPHPAMDPVDFVLNRFNRDESEKLPVLTEAVADALEKAIRSGLESAMITYNRAGSLGC